MGIIKTHREAVLHCYNNNSRFELLLQYFWPSLSYSTNLVQVVEVRRNECENSLIVCTLQMHHSTL